MVNMLRAARTGLLLGCLLFFPLAAQKLPFDVQAMMKLARISEPQISPDGRTIAFTVQVVDLNANKKPKQIYVVPVDGGGAARPLTNLGLANERARWSPDSKRIAFVSDRGGSSQIWIMNADGSGATQVTRLSTEAGGVLFSPDGKNLVFTSDVFPECLDDTCNQAKLDAEKNAKIAGPDLHLASLPPLGSLARAEAHAPVCDWRWRRRGERSYARQSRRAAVFSRRLR